MTRKRITRKAFDEDKFVEELEIVVATLADYGLELGDTLRYRKINTQDKWKSGIKVLGINKDISIACSQKGKFRAFLPGFAYDIEVKRKGPRGGTLWEPVTHQSV